MEDSPITASIMGTVKQEQQMQQQQQQLQQQAEQTPPPNVANSGSVHTTTPMQVDQDDSKVVSIVVIDPMNAFQRTHHHQVFENSDQKNYSNTNAYSNSNHDRNDIPPTIQSLQQQYYSSSSLSGDEEDEDDIDDDIPLVQSSVLALQQQQSQQQSQPMVMDTGSTNPHPQQHNNNTLETIVPNRTQQQQQSLPRRATATLTQWQSGTTNASFSSSTTHSGSSTSLQAQNSSQNSSHAWGWFDDIQATTHSTDHMLPNGMSSSSSGPNPTGRNKTKQKKGNTHNQQHRVTILDPSSMMMHDENHMRMMNAMAVTAPNYVLEDSLSSQFLWKNSAGQRPPQPMEERAFYEKMWAQNFERSQVAYNIPVEVLTATSPLSLDPFNDRHCDTGEYAQQNHHLHDTGDYQHPIGTAGTDIAEAALVYRMNDDRNQEYNHNINNNDTNANTNSTLQNYYSKPIKRQEVKDTAGDGTLTVLVRGDNVFGTTVSKSFARTNRNGDPIVGGVDTINISIASYRVVESPKHGKYAQFLVIYRQGSIRDTIGIWKRYRDFEELAHKVTQAHEGCVAALANMSPLHTVRDGDNETEHLPNAITSWRLLKKRKRWYRCLDAGYLSLKVFLLERFLHDILFESTSPHLLRDFVGVDSVSQMV
jgi:hypothetical protein